MTVAMALALLALAGGCARTSNPPTPETGKSTPSQRTLMAKETATAAPKASAFPAATGASAGTGKCADEGLIAVRVESQASHAGAKENIRLEIESRKLVGTSYEIENDVPKPAKVDRLAEADRVAAVVKVLSGICSPVITADKAQHSAPGGFTRWSMEYANGSVAAIYGAHVEVGEKYRHLTHKQFNALGVAWPESKPK